MVASDPVITTLKLITITILFRGKKFHRFFLEKSLKILFMLKYKFKVRQQEPSFLLCLLTDLRNILL